MTEKIPDNTKNGTFSNTNLRKLPAPLPNRLSGHKSSNSSKNGKLTSIGFANNPSTNTTSVITYHFQRPDSVAVSCTEGVGWGEEAVCAVSGFEPWDFSGAWRL